MIFDGSHFILLNVPNLFERIFMYIMPEVSNLNYYPFIIQDELIAEQSLSDLLCILWVSLVQ